MKAADFRYMKVASLEEALQVLDDHDGEALALAGGQSLLAGLNMRLSQPQLLVDINGLAELRGIEADGGAIRLGALTRHAELLGSALIAEKLPLLVRAVGHVGHVAIRNRGTLGGSLANADPAAELPACMVALGATIFLAGPEGRREIAAEDFFLGLFETAREENELIVEVRIPLPRPELKFGFAEFSRRHGDFAVAGVAAAAKVANGKVRDARLVYFGCSDRAQPAARTAAAVQDLELPLTMTEEIRLAVEADVAASDSPGWRADTKAHLAHVLTCRVLNQMGEGER